MGVFIANGCKLWGLGSGGGQGPGCWLAGSWHVLQGQAGRTRGSRGSRRSSVGRKGRECQPGIAAVAPGRRLPLCLQPPVGTTSCPQGFGVMGSRLTLGDGGLGKCLKCTCFLPGGNWQDGSLSCHEPQHPKFGGWGSAGILAWPAVPGPHFVSHRSSNPTPLCLAPGPI